MKASISVLLALLLAASEAMADGEGIRPCPVRMKLFESPNGGPPVRCWVAQCPSGDRIVGGYCSQLSLEFRDWEERFDPATGQINRYPSYWWVFPPP